MKDYSAIYLLTIFWYQICDSIQTSCSNLWPKLCNKTSGLVFMLKPLVQGWCVACATHTSHLISGYNCNHYYYLLSTLFVCLFMLLFVSTCALTIPSEVRETQDVIHPLINYALISDHLLRPFFHPARSSRVTSRPSSIRLCYQAYCLR